jgi:hypothetical protein
VVFGRIQRISELVSYYIVQWMDQQPYRFFWLVDVYDPQTKPIDSSDTRLIITDGHGSHATNDFMAFCFFNNIYCCYFPAHYSHGMQPLDNGPFNAVKAAYRKELREFNFNNDARPIDKINFIKAYNKAYITGLSAKNIQSAFRTTGNWPISRRKALSHPEIQQNKNNATPERELAPEVEYNLEVTPKTSRQIRDFGKNKSPTTRRHYNTIAKGYSNLEFELATKNDRIAALEAEVAKLTKTRKRKAIRNPNKRFMILSEALSFNEPISEDREVIDGSGVEDESSEEVIADEIEVENGDSEEELEAPTHRTRSDRAFKKPRIM